MSLGIFIIIMFAITGVVSAIFVSMCTDHIAMVGCICICICSTVFSHCANYGLAYRDGQIDAALGKQQYHLVTQPDKTVEWVPKDE